MNKIQLRKWSNRPYIIIESQLPKNILDIIDKVTSYKIKNFEFIDNQIYTCPKCGFWQLVIHATSDYCKRCKTQCNTGLWDGYWRLLSKTRQGKYYFPIGLLDTVEKTLTAIGFEVDLLGWPSEPQGDTHDLDLTWTSPWSLRSHQQEAVDLSLERLHQGRGCILELPTGSGKSLLATWIIKELKVNTLILVHKKNLMEQWNKGIKEALGWNADLFGDNQKDIGPITIAMIQSLSKANNFPFDMFDFVISDECVDGKTSIDTELGKLTIKEIVDKKMKIKVKTHTGEMKQIKNHYKIKTSKQMVRISYDGGQLECTEDHLLMTSRGWIQAKDLIPSRDVLYSDV